jgi:hypothetical protein
MEERKLSGVAIRPRKTAFHFGDRSRSLVRKPTLLMATGRRDGAVLAAVSGLIPADGDADGHAAGVLSVGQIAEAAKVSRNRVRLSLTYFRAMRVLWLRYQGESTFEIRFERRFVLDLLTAFRSTPEKITPLLWAHRREREAVSLRTLVVA